MIVMRTKIFAFKQDSRTSRHHDDNKENFLGYSERASQNVHALSGISRHWHLLRPRSTHGTAPINKPHKTGWASLPVFDWPGTYLKSTQALCGRFTDRPIRIASEPVDVELSSEYEALRSAKSAAGVAVLQLKDGVLGHDMYTRQL